MRVLTGLLGVTLLCACSQTCKAPIAPIPAPLVASPQWPLTASLEAVNPNSEEYVVELESYTAALATEFSIAKKQIDEISLVYTKSPAIQ